MTIMTNLKGNKMKRKIIYSITAGVALMALVLGCDNTQGGTKGKKAATSAGTDKLQQEAVDTVSAARSSDGGDPMLPGRLTGRWMRSDGDYIIEIFALDNDGVAKVGYFNPSPINVEKGDWAFTDGRLRVNVVLRDVNYPGSKYSLVYNPEDDTFKGSYYQAVEGITYDVLFSRMKQ